METFTFVTFEPPSLTCVSHSQLFGCTGTCCQPEKLSEQDTTVACDSSCLALDEAACTTSPQCYVARDVAAFYRSDAASFLGCFPQTTNATNSPCAQRDANTCGTGGTCASLSTHTSFDTFAECVDETLVAGSCTTVATCSTPPPSCPADHTAGVAAGCYTGSCIPNTLCM
jgi:hypothetical protein